MKNSLTIAVILLIAAGCSKQEERTSATVNPAAPAVDSVIVSVNGEKLTRSELSSYVEMMVEMQQNSGQKMNPDQVSAVRQELENTFPETWIHNILMAEYAKREGLEVTEKQLKRFQGKAMVGLGKKRGKNYAATLEKMGPSGVLFDRLVRAEALDAVVKSHLFSLSPTNVTPAEIANAQTNIILYNEMMAKTNALVFARANRVWQELKNGADFLQTAMKYSELEEEKSDNCEWGTIDTQQFASETNVCAWAVKMKVGEFTPPIEGDNGLMILRLDAKDAEKGEYTFSRIYFQLPLFAEKLTDKEIEDEVKSRHREELFLHKSEQLRQAAKIEFFEVKEEKKQVKQEGVK